MTKMSHAIAGRLSHKPLGLPVQPGTVDTHSINHWRKVRRIERMARWTRRHGLLLLSMGISLALHGLILFGFNRKAAPVRVAVKEEAALIQMAMPDLKDPEENKPVEELRDDEAVPDPGIMVPTLVDMPTVVPVDAFVQSLEAPPPAQTDLNAEKLVIIPVRISRSGGVAMDKLGKIFDLSQLDRVPEPLVQIPPVFPPNLKKEYSEATVEVGFVVNSNGEVVAPYLVRSGEHYGFDQAALAGVAKWKFRAGLKGGRKVNALMQVTILFRLKEGGD